MKVTLNWLKQYVDFDWSAEESAERLTMLGLEVEGVERTGGGFEGIVVAEVLSREQHPNADKLTVCQVADGQGKRQIVCGAKNFEVGDKVPMIPPGTALPIKPGEKPFTIKVGKIRGVESHGMMCSPAELGLSEEAAGLMLLNPEAEVGQPFAEYLGRDEEDVVLDLEVTPNRPDLNSMIGIAREIAAVTGNSLRIPDLSASDADSSTGSGSTAEELVGVRIDDAVLCPRYTARVITGVEIGPSPAWLRSAVEKVGLRSISNVVDATNYVMLETGQPLHAFDYHLIAKGAGGRPTIIVRRASDEEKFTTLDDQERTLDHDMLLIADEEKGIALAGVMGGLNTEINDRTVDILLESAYFNPTNIRRTSKLLGLRTDASYRFERGADPAMADWAGRRCAQLLQETAGGKPADGVVDAYPGPVKEHEISLRHHKVSELLGIELKPEEIEYYLSQLDLRIVGRKPKPVDTLRAPEPVTFRIPSFRVDLKREADLIEEVVRLHGVDKIPATPPRGAIGANAFDSVHDGISEARRILTGLGLDEAQGQTLISDDAARLVSEASVALSHPLSSDMNVLRPSLLPGLLDSLRHNLSHQRGNVALFEIGRAFSATDGKPREGWRLAIALTGRRHPDFWTGDDRDVRYDLFDLKGMIEEFADRYGLRGLSWRRRTGDTSLLLESATVGLGKLELGQMGQLLPGLAKRYDLRDTVFLAELDLSQILRHRSSARSFKALPQFPSTRRDVAMILAESVTHDDVLRVARRVKPENLERVELFDVFRGKNIPEGRKSLAYAFTYRNSERTLRDREVNTAHEKLVSALKEKLQATVREA